MNIKLVFGIGILSMGLTGAAFAYSMPAGGGEIGTSASMIGYGSIEGFSNGASAIFENSAGILSTKTGYSASTMWCQFPADSSYFNLAGAVSLEPQYALAFGIMKSSIANIDITSLNGNGEAVSDSQYSAGSTTLMLGGRWKWDQNVQLGLTIKTLNSGLSPTMSGTSMDIDPGALINTDYGQFSLEARNLLGSSITYSNGSKESVAREFAVAYQSMPLTNYHLSVMAEVRKKGDFLPKSLGFTVPVGSKSLLLSMGFREDVVVRTIHARTALGLSLVLDNLTLNYAMEPSDYFQQSSQHYLSIEFLSGN